MIILWYRLNLTILICRGQIDNLARAVETIEQTYSVQNPLIIDVPASSGNTTTVMDNRIMSTMTVLKVENYNTGLEVGDVTVKPIDGALIIGNINNEIALRVTLI